MNPDNQNELIPLTAGDVLRHKREQQGLSIETVAARVRVKPAIIAAIESGDSAHIPSVYLKGYIRSYSQQLGIAPTSIEKHLQHTSGNEPRVQSVFQSALPRNPGDRWFKASSYVLASAVVIALVWQFTNEAVRFSQGGSMAQSAGPAETQPDYPSADAGRAVTPAETTRPAETHFRASVASLETAHDGVSINARKKIAESAWAAVADPDQAATPVVMIGEGALSLSVATSADSWLEITDGSGQQVEMDLLRAGTRRAYRGQPPVSLLIGRASSVELSMNGGKVDLAPFTRGNVARLTLGEAPGAAADADSPAAQVQE